ncbi:MAG: glycine cleavage system aminomethyltransferase GcvT [Cyclobacteriaceae bacterium]|nr:glycine cleavage system aminomethyltransferase GcvT [Cyclobacteriaceae bacterium]
MEPKNIILHTEHLKRGARMVPFAGFNMPVRYSSDKEEHNCVRNGVGIFDVSHMGEFFVQGVGALDFIQQVTSNDASKLVDGKAQYSCLPNETGGIVDDLIVYRMAEEQYMLVVNAGNIQKDWNWLMAHNRGGVKMTNASDEYSLFAVQGPKALATLQKLTDVDLESIAFYSFVQGSIAGIDEVIISATGYTGAGGFELYIKNEHALKVWEAVMEAGQEFGILPIGLGARDTLRMEMGYCLYGNDIDDSTSPLEAGLGWITKFTKEFTNHEALKAQKEKGIERKLVGLIMEEKGIPRQGYELLAPDGTKIGLVTSGTMSPTLDVGIGLGYVAVAYSKPESELLVQIRNKTLRARVKKLPLV